MYKEIHKLIPLLLVLFLPSLVIAQEVELPLQEAVSETADSIDKCDQIPDQDKLPEKMKSGVHEFSCKAVRWIDGWFGDGVDFEEEEVGGKLSLGMSWNQFEGAKAKARYRVRSELPNFSSKWDGFFGRVEEDAYVSGTETLQESALRDGIGETDEPTWLLGLGYDDRKGSRKGWDYSVGLRLQTPIRTYVKARYRTEVQPDADTLIRFRQTVFWRDGTGFGTTSHLDTKRSFNSQNLLRLELVGTISEISLGTQWYAGQTWYHKLSDQSGIALLSFARGETDHPVALHEYGFEFTWRRNVAREWLFINFGPTLTWPKLDPLKERDASWGFAVLLDFEFGAYRD
ncbi:MAG: hypothetical protein ACI9H8_001932 [Lysobacterales bacterium]|jgi:hypothetical protein